MADESPDRAARKPEARSRIGNGKALFLGTVNNGEPIDGRTLPARVFRDVHDELISDLGGPDAITEAERQLVRRAASLSLECLIAESKQAAGQTLDLDRYVTATNALRRVLVTLGLRRRARDVTPDLHEYIGGGKA